MDDWVIVDACIWIPALSKPNSIEWRAVGRLVNKSRVAVIGPVLTEVLRGFRRKQHADWVANRLRFAHYVEITRVDWIAAADLGRELAALGHTLPLTDLTLAAVARRQGCWLYSTDPHFDLIPGIKRYRPK